MRTTPWFKPPLFALFAFLTFQPVFANDGDLDPSFGMSGITTISIGVDGLTAIGLQSDGKIVAAGLTDSTGQYDFALCRLNSNGTLDTSFGNSGIVLTDFFGFSDGAFDLAIQPDGKIIAAGIAWSGSELETRHFAFARYLSDGSLDNAFDGDGLLVIDLAGSYEWVTALTLQPDGKILAVGVIDAFSDDIAIVRLNSDGSPDLSFGSQGISIVGDPDPFAVYSPTDIALDSQGRIVISSWRADAVSEDFLVVRLLVDGSLDSTFGNSGRSQTDLGADDVPLALAVDLSDNILVTGKSQLNLSTSDFAIVKYLPDGTEDPAFGINGIVIVDFFGEYDFSEDITIQSDGKIVLAGGATNPAAPGYLALLRLNPTGSIDSSFGNEGKVTTDFPECCEYATSIVFDTANQKLLAAGNVGSHPNTDFAFARYFTTAAPTPRGWLGQTSIGNTIYAIGGGTGSDGAFGQDEVANVEAYDTSANIWSIRSPLQTARWGIAASEVNGKIYAIGGTSGSASQPLGDLEEYDPLSNTWIFKTSMLTPRWKLASSVMNGKIYAIGGGASGNQCQPSGIVEEYDPLNDSWASKNSMPTFRWGAASAELNGQIYVIGGSRSCPQIIIDPSPDLEVYDPASDTWSSKAPMSIARWDLVAASVNGKIYAIGGWDPATETVLDVLEEYDTVSNTWLTKAPMPTARTGAGASVVNGKIYVFGGFDGIGVTNIIEVYDPATDQWSTPCSPPVIITQPASQTIQSGETATMSVVATGTAPLSYQWYEGISGDTSNAIPGATSDTYTTPPLFATTNYWVRVTNDCGSIDSDTATITVEAVCDPPTITLEPPSPTILPGGTATLTVVSDGTPTISYQWYEGISGDTSNPITGETDDYYETPPLFTDTSYWARINNACGQVDSDTANVTISTDCPPPAITRQPRSVCVDPGWATTLSVEADGIGPFNYQWFQGSSYDDSVPIPGATSDTYPVPPLLETATRKFWVKVDNACGTTNSRIATVFVSSAQRPCCKPSVTSGPANQPVKNGKKAKLCVFAKRCTFSYQWYLGETGDTSNPVGNDEPEYETDNVTSNESYWVQVIGAGETYDSPTARVIVVPDPGPADDETKLLPDESDSDPLGDRIPLILIHGIHGNQWPNGNIFQQVWGTDKICEPYRDYWKHFLNYIVVHPTLRDLYKVYRFHYQSDHESNNVWQIARSFRNHLDAEGEADATFRDKPLVLVAHSMGGLVARTYMQEHSHNCSTGTYCGDRGGERTELLVTLATPHHGSPLANKDPRVPGDDSCPVNPLTCVDNVETWNDIVNCSDLLAWAIDGCPLCSCYPDLPNRADLRFDNFNGLWDGNPDYEGDELNDLLNRINQDIPYDGKIAAYYGHIGSDSEVLLDGQMSALELGQRLLQVSEDKFYNYALRAAGVLLERITIPEFDNQIGVLNNDGFVTIGSSAFDNHTLRNRVECKNRPENGNLGFDHLDMVDGGDNKICENGMRLFTSVYMELVAFSSTVQDTLTEENFYTEAFEHNNTSTWTFRKGTWYVDDEGYLVGSHNRKADAISDYWGCSDCTVEADLQIVDPGGRASLLGWYQDKRNNVEIRLMEDKQKILLKHKTTGGTAAKKSVPLIIVPGMDYHLKVIYDSATTSFKVLVDGLVVLDVPTVVLPSGTVGFRIKSTTGLRTVGQFAEILVY